MTLASENKTDDWLDEIYEDIKATLRVSIVPLPFRLWSSNPQLLELLWSRLRPNLETRFIECAADTIREKAVRMVSIHRVAHQTNAEEISQSHLVINIHHYINPKLLLVAAALLEALQNRPFEPVKDPRLSMSIPRGIPPEMPTIPLVEEPWLSHDQRTVLREIQTTLTLPEISTEYLGLAYRASCLKKAWLRLQPFTQTPSYWMFTEDVQSLGQILVRGLPFPLDVRWDDFARVGMTGTEIMNWIIPAQKALPGLILNMAALKVGLDGKEEALRSPYPI